jgi:hypothetical protein
LKINLTGLLGSVLAGWRVEAFVGESKAFDWLSADDVRVDDFVDVGFRHVAIPDGPGVDDDGRAVLALVEASGLISACAAFQSALGEFLLEEFLQTGFGERIAASAGIARRTLISADKDVMFEFRHWSKVLLFSS